MRRSQPHRTCAILLNIIAILSCFILATGSAIAVETHSHDKVRTTVKSLDLTRPPTTNELMAAGQLGGALYPTYDKKEGSSADAANLSFGRAMELWNRHEYREASRQLKRHIAAHSDSPWVGEAELHLACDAQYNGRYSEAKKRFERILTDNKGKNHPGAAALRDKAKLRLGVLKAYQNNLGEAGAQFSDLAKSAYDWRERTYAGHWLNRISKLKKSGKTALNCGNQALASLLERDGRGDDAKALLENLFPSEKGQSIRDLENGALLFDYPLVARTVAPDKGAELPVPAIVHLPAGAAGDSGHYWVLENVEGDSLTLFDPQAGKYFVQSAAEFAEQWDGVALVKANTVTGEPLSQELAGTIFGGCCGVPRAEEDLGCPDGKCKQGPSMNGGTPNGSPTWTVNMVNMNFYMTDIPLWYKSPIGPSVEIQLSYNSQSAIAANEPFGNKWQFSYASYLVVDTAGEVTVFMPDGRRDVYRPNNPLNPAAGYQKPYRVFNSLKYLGPNIYEISLPEGDTYRYAIPAGTTSLQPFLVEIRDTHNQKLTFGYNASVQLATITDAAGKTTSFTYNGSGLVTRVTDPFGRHADFTYDGSRNLTGITDMGGYSSNFTYDANIYLASIRSGGETWGVYIEPADGIDNNFDKYPLPGGVMWEDYRITVTNPQGGKEEYYYDGYSSVGWYKSPRHYGSAVKTLDYEYMPTVPTISGSRGEIMSIIAAEGDSVSYMHDSNGLVSVEIDSHDPSHASLYFYNSMGRLLSELLPNNTTNSLNYAANGVDITSVVNGLGTLALAYNATRDISSITDRMGKTTTTTFNSFGQRTTMTDSLGRVTTYTYDANHFPAQVAVNGITVKTLTVDAVGRVRTVTGSDGVSLTYDYNNLDDVTKVTWPDGKFVSLVYSNTLPHLVTAVTDRAGRTATFTYDTFKRLIQVGYPDGGGVSLERDKDGNVIRVYDVNSTLTRIQYDNDGRVVSRAFADGSRVSYTYDSAGLLLSMTNGRKGTATYAYDVSHNLTGITYSDGTPAVSYEYDAYNRKTRMVDGVGTYLYAYDANSRLLSIDGPWANDTITYQYDSEGRRTGVSVQGGLSTAITIDPLDRVTNVSNAGGSYTYSYSGASPLVNSLTRPNGSVTSYLYDTLSRLTGVTNKTSATAVISSYAYSYNAQGQRDSETIGVVAPLSFSADEQTVYSYDNLNRLLAATPSASFTYDADGNMTGGVTPGGFFFTAQYDAHNRLESIQYTDGTGTVRRSTFTFNGAGFLAVKKEYSNGILTGETRYLRDRALVFQERDGSNAATADYSWGIGYGGGVGGLLGLKKGVSNYSYLYDGKGNVTALIDSAQSLAAEYAYDPFGALLRKAGTLEQSYQFSTKPYDSATGLSYFGYRFYSPATGRWLSRDPLGMRFKELNPYVFVKNNPNLYVDPLGLEGGIWGKIKDWYDKGKNVKDTVDTVTEAANDAVEAKEAIDDPNPKSGFKLLKLTIKNTCGRIPGVGSAIKKIMTGAVETAETAPGGVEASERQAETGTINIGAARQMSQIEW